VNRIALHRLVIATVAACLTCCLVLPSYAGDMPAGAAAQKLDPDKFEQKLQDTRENISKNRLTPSPSDSIGTSQVGVDICKRNPNLPQCKLQP
jgi:hypothetical protein